MRGGGDDEMAGDVALSRERAVEWHSVSNPDDRIL